MVEESLEVVETNQKRRFGWAAALILLVALGAIWMLVRPGVFTVQPIGALPDGATVVYIGR